MRRDIRRSIDFLSYWAARGLSFAPFRKASKRHTGNIALPARTVGEPIRRILVVKLDHMGDLLVAFRAFEILRGAWPDAHITLLCGPWNTAFAEASGYFDRIVPHAFFAAKAGEQTIGGAFDYAGAAAAVGGDFDLTIDLRHDGDTRPLLDLVAARYRAGFFARGMKRPLDLELPIVEDATDPALQPLHAETRLSMLASAVVAVFAPPAVHPVHRLIAPETDAPRPFDGRPYAVIAVGAGTALRQWPIERYADVARHVVERHDLGVVLIGGPKDRADNAELAAGIAPERGRDLTDLPLKQLPAVIAGARLFVGNDTGTTHLAAMLGVPTLCLYAGVSDPRVWQPVGPRVSIVHAEVHCSYCHLIRPESCRHGSICMTEISVADAVAELDRLLAGAI